MTVSRRQVLPEPSTRARPATWQATLLVVGVTAAGVVPGSTQYRTWDGTDALLTGCSAAELRPPDGFPALLGDAAVVSLRYSYGCRTVWAELAGARPGAEAWVERASDGRRQACTTGPDGRCTTSQLDDADTYACAGARDGAAAVQTACH
jgi:hypothetical protein